MKRTVIVAGLALAASVVVTPVAMANPSPMWSVSPMQADECQAATAALEDGQTKKRRLDEATEALAQARADARGAVKVIAPDFPVDTASASDIQVAIDEMLRQRRDDPATNDEDRALWDNAMNVAKALRDALNEHQRAAEAFQGVDLAALETAKDEACAEPEPTTEPEPTDEPEPAPTTTPTPEPSETPEPSDDEQPAAVDLDCKDFPLADGRTAQDILNLTPNSDPFGLDADKDRIACESGEDTAPDSSSDFADTGEVVVNDDVAVPSGGVATGVGPA